MQIMKGLSKHTFDVFSCCSLSKEQEEELSAEGVQIINMQLSEYNPVASVLRLSKIIRSENIHIVHSQGGRADVYARVAGVIVRTPLIVSSTAVLVDRYEVTGLKKVMYVGCDRWTERCVNKFIVVSESLRESLIKDHGIEGSKITKIYNGIELDRFQPSVEDGEKFRRECNIDQEGILVGSVGRLVYEKGYEFLIGAWPMIVEAYPKAKVVIVGDGPLKCELEALARELRIVESCYFIGFREDISMILSSLDVFVLPSIMEGLPMAILEAMAMEKPIVATDIDGVREEIENGRTGILVPPGDSRALGEAIHELLKDRWKARKFAVEARKRVEEMFELKRQLGLYEELYKELVKGSRAEV